VVWTGDSARHDNDEHYPRTITQVTDLNKFVVNKFVETFGKDDYIDDPDPTNDFVVPIVPTFGNNDILPHNIFLPGPNRWTRKYEDIWRKFVPQEQKHSFARGGWFFSEVIPNRLAVFSLNTLYFFESNAAVDGCDAKTEPGYEHMEWLRIQLQFLRQRGMKAILIGHVPPARTDSKQNWDESCFQKYTLWMRQYRDVVLTSIWGHMNIDHFIFQDVKDLAYKFRIDGVDDEFERKNDFDPDPNEPTFSAAAKVTYLNELRDSWAQLPKPPKGSSYNSLDQDDLESDAKNKRKKRQKDSRKKFLKEIGGPYGERFSLSLVSPSVVPNFFPTLRIVEYNITGLEDDHPADGAIGVPAELGDVEQAAWDDKVPEDNSDDTVDAEKKKKRRKKHKKSKPKFPVPLPPSSTAAPGPAYSPQSLSLLSWTQYYANLTTINADVKKDGLDASLKPTHKHFNFEVEYSTANDTVYRLQDLTVRSWLELAERIGRNAIKEADVQVMDEESDKDQYDAHETDDIDEENDSEGDDNAEAKKHDNKKKHKKKKGKSTKKKMRNHVWKTFVRRVFVGAKPDEDLDEDFGNPVDEVCDC
jgi:endopolyphosphatase